MFTQKKKKNSYIYHFSLKYVDLSSQKKKKKKKRKGCGVKSGPHATISCEKMM